MNRSLRGLIAALCAVFPLGAAAQLPTSDECGSAPGRNISYSSDIRNVAATLAARNSSTKINSGAKMIYEGIPIEGFLNIDKNNTETLKTDLSQAEVVTYVQKELADNKTAIVAECMYYFCKATKSKQEFAGAQLAAITGAGSICKAALTGDLPKATDGGISALPNFNYVEVLTDTPVRTQVRLSNTGPSGSVALARPLTKPGSVVSYQGVIPTGIWENIWALFGMEKEFRLDPGQNRTAVFEIARPAGPTQSETVQLQHGFGGGGVDIAFAIARDKPKSRPLNCDYLNEDGYCGQCTVALNGQNLSAQPGHPGFSMACPKMSAGSFQVSWNISVAFSIPCGTALCAGFDGTLTIEADKKPILPIPISIKGQQTITGNGLRSDAELRLDVPSEVVIRYAFGQAYTHTPGPIRAPISFSNSTITVKSLKK